jgi:transposase
MDSVLGRQLVDEERRRLQSWRRCEDRVRYVRAQVVLLAETSPSAAGVARAIGVHVQTVRDLLRTFRAKGLSGLEPKPRPGMPRRFAEKAEEVLIEIIHERPERYGLPDTRWTLQMAARVLAQQLGLESVSTETVRRLLQRRRHSWQRAKEWIDSPDPEYVRKKGGVPA